MNDIEKFEIIGTVQRIETGPTSLADAREAVDVYVQVLTYKNSLHEYRIGAFSPSVVAVAKTLRQGQQIIIGGRLTGSTNGKFYNVYLNADHIFLLPAPAAAAEETSGYATRGASSVPPSGSHPSELGYGAKTAYVPPRNGKEAAQ